LDLIARDDKLGRLLQDNELKPRRRPARQHSSRHEEPRRQLKSP
jgi:hypothetical protein